MYDFTSAHVLQAVQSGLSEGRKLSLVLDHPPRDPTADQTDEQTEAALSQELGSRQQFAWAADAFDPKVTKSFFPTAYHIKVAVKDHDSFWLSSGNWNNSNQPDINPFPKSNPQIDAIAKKSDRDWHVIVQHAGLAKTFEAYLQHDLAAATPLQVGASTPALPSKAANLSPEKPIAGSITPAQYFEPLQIANEAVKIQPILTPDAGAGNYATNILNLIQSARKSLYIQTQYIHLSPAGTDAGFQALIDAVKGKMKAGLDVRIILSEFEATGNWLELLQAAGLDMSAVRIQNGVHNKGIVVDSETVVVGSQNWSGDAVLRNRDASLIIYHQGAAQYFEQIFIHDWTTLAKQSLSAHISSDSSE
jgi:phosphatidylserine/phosphatidylglycerophosphate/cardiolipin synthase-like enzyme